MKYKILVKHSNVVYSTWSFYSEHNDKEKTMDHFESDNLENAKDKVKELINRSRFRKNEIKIVQVHEFDVEVS